MNPSNWTIKQCHGEANRAVITDGNGHWVAAIQWNGEFTDEQQRKLDKILTSTLHVNIDLLEAAKTLLKEWKESAEEFDGFYGPEILKLEKAIQKAEGK